MMMIILLASVAFSAVLLAFLCLGDPKRRRSARLSGKAQGTAVRRLSAAASLLPGIIYALSGDAAAFLIWLGGYAVVGWLVTLSVSGLRDKSERLLENAP